MNARVIKQGAQALMLRSLNALLGAAVRTMDGEAGKVDQFLFDDSTWTVRYLVADHVRPQPARKVLVARTALRGVDRQSGAIAVALTCQEVQAAEDLARNPPVSLQCQAAYERAVHRLVESGPPLTGSGAYPPGMVPGSTFTVRPDDADHSTSARRLLGDPHLRSTRAVTGYRLQARDGRIGHVEDFIVEDEGWTIWYLVVNTRTWWRGRKVILSPYWVAGIHCVDGSVQVNLQRATIKAGVEYDADALLNREIQSPGGSQVEMPYARIRESKGK